MATKTLTKTRKESKAENGATKTCHKILAPLQGVDFPYKSDCQPIKCAGRTEDCFRLEISGLDEPTASEITRLVAAWYENDILRDSTE